MKKILALTTVLSLCILALAGCVGMDFTGTGQPQPTESAAAYTDESAFARAVADQKASDGADEHNLKGVEHYYVFKKLPDQARTTGVKALSFAVRVQYAFGETRERDFENQMELVWYRNTSGTEYMSKVSEDPTAKQISGDGMSYVRTVAKALVAENSQETFDYCQIVYWSQDDQAFMAALPMSFTEDDIRTYCVAEKKPLT